MKRVDANDIRPLPTGELHKRPKISEVTYPPIHFGTKQVELGGQTPKAPAIAGSFRQPTLTWSDNQSADVRYSGEPDFVIAIWRWGGKQQRRRCITVPSHASS